MSKVIRHIGAITAAAAALAVSASAQPPQGGDPAEGAVKQAMAMDKNHDGKLQRSEVTDQRYIGIYDQIDTAKKGYVTPDQIRAYFRKMAAGRPGGAGGPGGGRGGFRPGQLMPGMLADRLKLTDAQKKQFDALQKEVDAKVAKILTADQKKQLEELRARGGRGGGRGEGGGRGPEGPGGPGGPAGFGARGR
jgi:Spy/CpxP family protein refolding chaperone